MRAGLWSNPGAMTTADALPEDMPGLRAAALALLAERDELLRRVDRMHHIIRQFQRAQFGRHSEKLDPDQLQLGLEEREIARAHKQATAEKQTTASHPRLEPGRRKSLPAHLPRIEVIIEPETTSCGIGPPAVVYTYAPGRGAEHAITLLAFYRGIVQCDGYAAYKQVAHRGRAGNAVILAFCWAHWRRRFYEIAKAGSAPIAEEALRRIAGLYKIEAQIRGNPAAERRAVRQAESKPVVEDLKTWLAVQLARASAKSAIAVAIRYGLNHCEGLTRFLEDGRIETWRSRCTSPRPARRRDRNRRITRLGARGQFLVMRVRRRCWSGRCGRHQGTG
jgi:hypothetical protein